MSRLLRIAVLMSFAALAPWSTSFGGGTLVLPVEFTGDVTHDFVPPSEGPAFLRDTAEMSLAEFSADLGEFSEIVFSTTAPGGAVYSVTPHGGADTSRARLSFTYSNVNGASFGFADVNGPPTIEFIGLTGTSPTLTDLSALTTVFGESVGVDVAWTLNGPFSFRGLSFSFPGPFSSGGTIEFGEDDRSLEFTQTFPGSPPDPGPIVTVIPEPASLALLGLGAAALAARRRDPNQ